MIKQRPVLASRVPTGPRATSLGNAHYSYGFAADKFLDLFRAHRVPVRVIDAPEQFKSETFARLSGLEPGEHLHLIFRSTEGIRTIAGAYNVACFAWEFEDLKDDGLPEESILKDQVRMLRSCDEVWVPCIFTKQVLARHGIDNAQVIPAPIAAPAGRRRPAEQEFAALASRESVALVSRSSGSEADYIALARTFVRPLGDHEKLRSAMKKGRVFLTVCNPYDKRKNLASTIEGFLMATQGQDDVVLLVKLVTSGIFETPSGYLFHQMRVIFGNPHCIHEDRVILFSGYLKDEDMTALYRCATFYLCASIAEGQNLPLLEAMAHGCVPVSVRNTAMGDYIDETNAVPIRERRFSGLQSHLAGHVAQTRLTTDFADRFAIADAVTAALALDAVALQGKAASAASTVHEKFSPRRVFRAIQDRLAGVRPALIPRAADTLWLKLLGKQSAD